MELHRPRQWGACWLACRLYEQLELDRFFAPLLPNSRDGTSWQHILQTLVCCRLNSISQTDGCFFRHNKSLPPEASAEVTTHRRHRRPRQNASRGARRAAGETLGPLAGVPFAAKNMFDVAGLPTRAGSKINRQLPPAQRDSPLVERLEAAGAVLVGALNMGEYAYDFTGENIHDGPSRNPHDTTRMTGGSPGGSACAVAGRLVPLALGSDTNGSIRVPSSLCGVFELKRPMAGCRGRAASRSWRASIISGRSRESPPTTPRATTPCRAPIPPAPSAPAEPTLPFLEREADGLRIAVAGGYFRNGVPAEAEAAGGESGGGTRLGAKKRASRIGAGAGCRLCHRRSRRRGPSSRPAALPGGGLRPGGARPANRGRDDSRGHGRRFLLHPV
jgi:1-carboxybiuret hydrolase